MSERDELAVELFMYDFSDKLTVEECVPLADRVYELGFRRSGPVTDAQVEAARSALAELYGEPDWITPGDIRLALEAARGA